MVNEGKVMEEAKAKALQAALAQIEKQFGKGSIMKMDSQPCRTSRSFPPVRSGSTSRSAWADCRGAAWWRSTGRSPRARRPSPCP